jgi:ferredoxin--NADP+ reductase
VTGLFRVERTERLVDKIFQMRVKAPHVAHHVQAGQFAMFRIDEKGERIPLTMSAVAGDLIRMIFPVAGKNTPQLASLRTGDHIKDVAVPPGKPGETAKYGTCAVVGGGWEL